jgi:hypothetical protein
MSSKIIKLWIFYTLISTILSNHENSVSAIWEELGKLTNTNKPSRHIKRGSDESSKTQFSTKESSRKTLNSDDKKETKHSHMYNIDLNTIRSEYNVEDALRYLCIYPKWCQSVSRFYISPLNTFSCSEENLLIHLDVQTFDETNSTTFKEPKDLKSVAYLPPKGSLQPTKKTTDDCPVFRV